MVEYSPNPTGIIEPGQPQQSSGQADILGSEQTPGDRWKLPITSRVTHVISKTLIKTKVANCTRLCCLCCGSVMASTLPWARSLLLHRGCFALSCLFSSYWAFWQDSRCLPRLVEQEGVLQCCPRAAGQVQVNPPHAREKSHSTSAAAHPTSSTLQLGPGDFGSCQGCGEPGQPWLGLLGPLLGRSPDGPRSPGSQSPR